jgi:hypothetical protein
MSAADKAKQLQAERYERENIARKREEMERRRANMKEVETADLRKRKTEELLVPFGQFKGFKVLRDHVTVEIEMKYDPQGGCIACLKAGFVGSSVLNEIRPGTYLVKVVYEPSISAYRLERCQLRNKTIPTYVAVGDYENVDKLMDAVAHVISTF